MEVAPAYSHRSPHHTCRSLSRPSRSQIILFAGQGGRCLSISYGHERNLVFSSAPLGCYWQPQECMFRVSTVSGGRIDCWLLAEEAVLLDSRIRTRTRFCRSGAPDVTSTQMVMRSPSTIWRLCSQRKGLETRQSHRYWPSLPPEGIERPAVADDVS